jgi:hypothetical protein
VRNARGVRRAAPAVLGAGLIVVGCDSPRIRVTQSGSASTGAVGFAEQVEVHRISAAAFESESERLVAQDLYIRSESDQHTSFSIVRGVTVDDADNIYVLDELASELRVFKPNGQFSMAIGKKGHGPGEFWGPRGLAIGGDTLFVQHDVVSLFNTDGRFMGQTRPSNYDIRATRRLYYAAGNLALSSASKSSFTGAPGFDTTTLRLYDVSRDTAFTPVVWALSYNVTSMGVSGPDPLGVGEATAVSANGLIFRVNGDSFAIEVYDGSGRFRHRIVSDVERIPTTATDVDDDLDTRLAIIGNNSAMSRRVDAKAFSAAFRNRQVPKYRPVIARMIAAPDGALLLQRYDISVRPYATSDRDVIKWSLVDSSWKPLGNIELPRRFEPFAFVRCYVVGVLKDEDDVAAVARYRIARDGPGGYFDC